MIDRIWILTCLCDHLERPDLWCVILDVSKAVGKYKRNKPRLARNVYEELFTVWKWYVVTDVWAEGKMFQQSSTREVLET